MLRVMLLSVALSVSAVPAASAAPHQMESDAEFRVIDSNGDGAIDRQEAEAQTRYSLLPLWFSELDLDGSGRIEHDEWGRARAYLQMMNAGGPSVRTHP